MQEKADELDKKKVILEKEVKRLYSSLPPFQHIPTCGLPVLHLVIVGHVGISLNRYHEYPLIIKVELLIIAAGLLDKLQKDPGCTASSPNMSQQGITVSLCQLRFAERTQLQ